MLIEPAIGYKINDQLGKDEKQQIALILLKLKKKIFSQINQDILT